MKKVAAIVGMAGSGKTEAAAVFMKHGFSFIRLGQITLDEVVRRGLKPGEDSEKPIRETIRKKHGMAAYATLNFPKIDALLKRGNVVADGLYSWEEYIAFRNKYGKKFYVVAVYSSPRTRYKRLQKQKWDKEDKKMIRRHYMPKEAESRDFAELEKSKKGGPIAMADFTIINEVSKKDFIKNVEEIVRSIK
ncbi:MAG: AAA family ATPase [Candidatus Aenigmarchaeota archaeon]|nr:AAA family ATPase [Candidatus Aenigmarchaeota archaeon]